MGRLRDLTCGSLATAVLVLAGVHQPAAAGEDPGAVPKRRDGERHALLEVASESRAAVVGVTWQPRGGHGPALRRQGVVVRADGLLVVSGPVPEVSGRYHVELDASRLISARLLGQDAETGLSLLQAPGLRRPVLAALTQPAPAPVGRRAVLVTATGAVGVGSVRAQGRRVQARHAGRTSLSTALYEGLLPTAEGDAGAPWLDAEGRLVGLHYGRLVATAPEAPSESEHGLTARPEVVAAYAVPARTVGLVWPLLLARGEVPRAGLAIWSRPLEGALRAHLTGTQGGHEVIRVQAGGAGAVAGLQSGDVLIGLRGRVFGATETLQDALLPFRPGTEVVLRVLRRGAPTEVPVRLGRREP